MAEYWQQTTTWSYKRKRKEYDNAIELDITGAFVAYTKDVQKKIKEAAKQTGEEMYNDVMARVNVGKSYTPNSRIGSNTPRSYSPSGIRYGKVMSKREAGTYKKQFVLKKLTGRSTSRIVYGVVNTTDDYRLNHLIDLGHKMPKGGYFEGTHFLSIPQQKANERLTAAIDRILAEQQSEDWLF